jgi:hypothetical protein
LKLIFEGNAFVAIVPMLAAVPVMPAILETFKYEPIGIFAQEFGGNLLVAVF